MHNKIYKKGRYRIQPLGGGVHKYRNGTEEKYRMQVVSNRQPLAASSDTVVTRDGGGGTDRARRIVLGKARSKCPRRACNRRANRAALQGSCDALHQQTAVIV
jgi:hypothetical protein